MKVSIIIPVIRPEKAKRCVQAIVMSFKGEASCISSYGDRIVYLLAGAKGIADYEVEILAHEDAGHIGCPRMVAKLTAMAQGEHILFLGDDTIPQPGFLHAALAAMDTLSDGWGLVCLNDGVHHGNFATHWLASKKLLEHLPGGEFFHTGYRHGFCDRELTDVARELGRYVYAPEARLIHDHPQITGEQPDEHYQRVYSRENYSHDQRLYWERKRERMGFKLGVGFPVVGDSVPTSFFASALCMVPTEYTLFLPRMGCGAFADSITSVRNDLVEQALEAGCTHLLMADTDQVYPAGTIQKLLSHEKDIVGVAVHRRWPPYDLVMLRGQLGSYTHVPEGECYSGDLVPVDATGTGCLLFDMRVFLDVPRPWFEFGTRNGRPVGEDIMFCSKARQAGFEIYVDTSIQVDHLTTLRVDRGTRALYRKLNRHEFAPPSGAGQ